MIKNNKRQESHSGDYERKFSELVKEIYTDEEREAEQRRELTDEDLAQLVQTRRLKGYYKFGKAQTRRKWSTAVAVLVFGIVVSMVCNFAFIQPAQANKDKTKHEKLVDKNTVVVYEGYDMGDEIAAEEVKEITSWEEIGLAKEFLPELYVPAYLSEGYAFQKLRIEKFENGRYSSEYIFFDEKEKGLAITQSYVEGEGTKHTVVSNYDETAETQLGTVYVMHFLQEDTFTGVLNKENMRICVTGATEKEELIKIFGGLQQ